jgi:DMSO/TMAO reductase YedYZ molybdopterin-dependent catalytic subunit
VITTVGDKIDVLSRLSVFAQRTGAGPQRLTANQTAAATGVIPKATDSTWALEVVGRARSVRLTRDQLIAMAQRTATLPIACVEGWSVSAEWQGVALRDLLALVDEPPTRVRLTSLEHSVYGSSDVSSQLAAHPDTLVALRLNGEQLDVDHGYPARLIAPNRPGAMQTKWLERIEVLG